MFKSDGMEKSALITQFIMAKLSECEQQKSYNNWAHSNPTRVSQQTIQSWKSPWVYLAYNIYKSNWIN